MRVASYSTSCQQNSFHLTKAHQEWPCGLLTFFQKRVNWTGLLDSHLSIHPAPQAVCMCFYQNCTWATRLLDHLQYIGLGKLFERGTIHVATRKTPSMLGEGFPVRMLWKQQAPLYNLSPMLCM